MSAPSGDGLRFAPPSVLRRSSRPRPDIFFGAVARLPVGLLADRFGGRVVFSVLMLVAAVPVALTPAAASYERLLATALFLGLAGPSFSVGVSYASRWARPHEQGTALGSTAPAASDSPTFPWEALQEPLGDGSRASDRSQRHSPHEGFATEWCLFA